jgi:hypothetical protein
VSDSNQQLFFTCNMARKSYLRWWCWLFCTRPSRVVGLLILLVFYVNDLNLTMFVTTILLEITWCNHQHFCVAKSFLRILSIRIIVCLFEYLLSTSNPATLLCLSQIRTWIFQCHMYWTFLCSDLYWDVLALLILVALLAITV